MTVLANSEETAADKRAIHVERCGAEATPIVIVDNFSPTPDALIEIAATAEFADRGEYYPGPRAPAPKSYIAGVSDILAKVAKNVFGCKNSMNVVRALYAIATRRPGELTLAQRVPHIDEVDDKAFAVVHFLSRDNFGGTAFYRHRSTGFEVVNEARQERFLASLKDDFSKFGIPPPAYISGDTEIFERILRVDARFNRALIYPGNLLHCAELPNGALLPLAPRTGRLTITTFLQAS